MYMWTVIFLVSGSLASAIRVPSDWSGTGKRWQNDFNRYRRLDQNSANENVYPPLAAQPSGSLFINPNTKELMILSPKRLYALNQNVRPVPIAESEIIFPSNYNYPESLSTNLYSVRSEDTQTLPPLLRPRYPDSTQKKVVKVKPIQSSNKAKENKFIVTATSEDDDDDDDDDTVNNVELTKPKFLVTEGYRNVLVQGANSKQKPESSPQTQQSKKVLKKQAFKGKNPLSSSNLLQSSDKPRKYFERPSKYEDEYESVFKNYRDNRLHEPGEDTDPEKEDDDDDYRIKDDHEKLKEYIPGEDDEEDEDEEESGDDEDEKVKVDAKSANSDENATKEKPEEDKSNADKEEEEEEEVESSDEEEKAEEQKPVPYSEHAEPKEIPTQPIYPGQGLWAKKGIKHRPYVSQHKFISPEDNEQKPDGYDVFEELEKYFHDEKKKFGDGINGKTASSGVATSPIINQVQHIKSPNAPNPIIIYNPFTDSGNKRSPNSFYQPYAINNQPSASSQKSEEDFVPMQIYTQVRKIEDVAHEPRNPAKHGQLKEVIKDSKVQTVYSEEGFEDAAYDHAGHEKKAEKDQAFEKIERAKQAKDKKKHRGDNEENQSSRVAKHIPLDSVTSDTTYPTEVPKDKMKQSNNFISTKKVQTTHVKDQDNGDLQLEIESELKVVAQPNNSTKAHKYVKIYPKVFKIEHMTPNISVEETTEKLNVSHSASNVSVDKIKSRRKREADGPYEEVDIDTKFIDKINHTFAPSTPKPGVDTVKYPYYKQSGVNQDSPLRYAENIANVPVKTGDALAFYDMADRMGCPDLPEDVDPIPDHIKEANEDSESEEREPPEHPDAKIELGDKIDCLKVRYFGVNPLDNPIFKEETIEPVKPIFKELARKPKSVDSVVKASKVVEKVAKVNEVFSEKPKSEERKFENEAKDKTFNVLAKQKIDHIVENVAAESLHGRQSLRRARVVQTTTQKAPVTLITTPKYTIQLTPNNIYDQITLLDHLPVDEQSESSTGKSTEIKRQSRVFSETSIGEIKVDPNEDGWILDPQSLRARRPPMFQIFDVNKFLTTTQTPMFKPKRSTQLPKQKVISEVFYKEEIKPSEQLAVFADVLNNIKNSTVTGKSNLDFAEPVPTETPKRAPTREKKFPRDNSRFQEKTYGERVIDHSYRPATTAKSATRATTTKRPLTKLSSKKIHKPRRKTTTTTSTTTEQSLDNQVLPDNHKAIFNIVGLVPPPEDLETPYKTIFLPQEEAEEEVESESSTLKEPAPVTEDHEESYSDRPLNTYYFLGLKPPAKPHIRPLSDNSLVRRKATHYHRSKREANRPSYADLSRNRGRHVNDDDKETEESDDDYVPHRPKNYHYDEKTGKIVYHTKPKVEEEEDEEYEEIEVPNSPGVYLERAEGATHPTPEKVTTKKLLATATPPPEGKGLLDFVVKLKNNPGYKYIPDPTTPAPGSATTIAASSSNINPKSTQSPEFLSLLAKVKSNKNYRIIEDPTESQNKPKPVTSKPVPVQLEADDDEDVENDEAEEVDDDLVEPVYTGANRSRPVRQISNLKIFNIGDFLPKIQTPTTSDTQTNFFQKHVVEQIFPRLRYMTPYDIARERYRQTDLYKFIQSHVPNAPRRQPFQIFDIGEFLPKIRTVEPSTPIDYSRYTTIERIRAANNDEEESKETVVTRPPPKEEELKTSTSTTTSTTTTTTTTARSVQARRGTRPSSTQKLVASEEQSQQVPQRRRRPLPIRGSSSTTATTTSRPQADATVEKVAKIYPDRRSTEKPAYSDKNDKARRVYRKRPTRIRHTTERQEEDNDEIDKIVRRSLDGKFEDSYGTQRIGEEPFDVTLENINGGILGAYNLAGDLGSFGSNVGDGKDFFKNDERDKKVEEFWKDVESKGEEFGESKREIVQEKPKDAKVFDKNYDKTKKHGGNYKKENENKKNEKGTKEPEEKESKIDAEVKKVPALTGEKIEVEPKKKDEVVIVNPNYDKTKKHGGNYKRIKEEDEDEEEEKDEEPKTDATEEKKDLKVVNPTNGKTIEDTEEEEKAEEEEEDVESAAADQKGLIIDVEEEDIEDNDDEDEEEDDRVKKLENSAPLKQTFGNEQEATIDELLEVTSEESEAEGVKHPRIILRPTTTTTSTTTMATTASTTTTPLPLTTVESHETVNSSHLQQAKTLGSQKVAIKFAPEVPDQIAEEGDVVLETATATEVNPAPSEFEAEDEDEEELGDEEDDVGEEGLDDEEEDEKDVDVEADEAITTTEKPLFVTDPSKRLYYYVKA